MPKPLKHQGRRTASDPKEPELVRMLEATGMKNEGELSRYLGYDKGLLTRRRRTNGLFSEVDYRLVAAECHYYLTWLKTGMGKAQKPKTLVEELSPILQEVLAVAQMISPTAYPTMLSCLRLLALGHSAIVQMIDMMVASVNENIRLGSTLWRQPPDR